MKRRRKASEKQIIMQNEFWCRNHVISDLWNSFQRGLERAEKSISIRPKQKLRKSHQASAISEKKTKQSKFIEGRRVTLTVCLQHISAGSRRLCLARAQKRLPYEWASKTRREMRNDLQSYCLTTGGERCPEEIFTSQVANFLLGFPFWQTSLEMFHSWDDKNERSRRSCVQAP